MKEEKSLTFNSIFYLFYNIVNVIFPFITGIYVTHVLLPNTIGQVEIARNLVQYFIIFASLGIPNYGLREISKYRNEQSKLNKIYSELMIIYFISTIIFSILYLLIVVIIPAYREKIILFLIVGFSITLNMFNNSWLFEGMEKFKYIAIRNLFFKIISFLLLILLVRNNNDYLIYAFIGTITLAGNYIINNINSKKIVKFTIKNLNLKRHLKPIMYLVVVNLAIEIYSLVDVTMLGFMCPKENVAYYTYAIKIYKILLQIINSFTIVLVPKITLYYKEKRIDKYNEAITKTLKVILLLSIPAVIGIFFTSDYLICLIYGNNYITSAYILKIIGSIIVIAPIGYLLGSSVCLITNNENKMIIPVICSAIINLFFNFILIPKYNELGAAIASVITEFLVMIIYIHLGRKYYRLINMKELYVKEGIALLSMTIFLVLSLYLHVYPFIKTLIQIVLSIIIYFGILLLEKEEFVYKKFNSLKYKIYKKQ